MTSWLKSHSDTCIQRILTNLFFIPQSNHTVFGDDNAISWIKCFKLSVQKLFAVFIISMKKKKIPLPAFLSPISYTLIYEGKLFFPYSFFSSFVVVANYTLSTCMESSFGCGSYQRKTVLGNVRIPSHRT